MSLDILRQEFLDEAAKTRKMLSAIPENSIDWRPHVKSSTLGQLAMHVANNPVWITVIQDSQEYDFNDRLEPAPKPDSKNIILDHFEKRISESMKSLDKITVGELDKLWTCRQGDKIYFSISKEAAIRSFTMNHLIHHRGQLSVYLRLLDIPVPGMYGPSGDGI